MPPFVITLESEPNAAGMQYAVTFQQDGRTETVHNVPFKLAGTVLDTACDCGCEIRWIDQHSCTIHMSDTATGYASASDCAAVLRTALLREARRVS